MKKLILTQTILRRSIMASKKQHSAWRVTLTVLLGMVMFTACPSEGNARGAQEEMRVAEACGRFGRFESEGLSAEMERRILLDFYERFFGICKDSLANLTYPRLGIAGYHGTYNGYSVVSIAGFPNIRIPFNFYFAGGVIADIPICRTFAWKDGQFYHLLDLVAQGKLTPEDQRSIANHHPRWVPGR